MLTSEEKKWCNSVGASWRHWEDALDEMRKGMESFDQKCLLSLAESLPKGIPYHRLVCAEISRRIQKLPVTGSVGNSGAEPFPNP